MLEKLKIVLWNPRMMLLVDAGGAAMTAIATFYLLAGRRIEVGLPVEILYAMAIVAACFACFDIAAFCVGFNASISLRTIACANLGYCMFVILLLFLYQSSVTSLGVAYFCIEIPIVATIAVWEWIIASRRDVV